VPFVKPRIRGPIKAREKIVKPQTRESLEWERFKKKVRPLILVGVVLAFLVVLLRW